MKTRVLSVRKGWVLFDVIVDCFRSICFTQGVWLLILTLTVYL